MCGTGSSPSIERHKPHTLSNINFLFCAMCLSLNIESGSTSATGTDSSQPTLQYSLYYDIQRNSLTVSLSQAFNLPKAKSGSGDTSVILYLQPNKAEVFESKVVRKDLNPIFDETFEFTGLLGVQVARKQTLIFKVYGRSRYIYWHYHSQLCVHVVDKVCISRLYMCVCM